MFLNLTLNVCSYSLVPANPACPHPQLFRYIDFHPHSRFTLHKSVMQYVGPKGPCRSAWDAKSTWQMDENQIFCPHVTSICLNSTNHMDSNFQIIFGELQYVVLNKKELRFKNRKCNFSLSTHVTSIGIQFSVTLDRQPSQFWAGRRGEWQSLAENTYFSSPSLHSSPPPPPHLMTYLSASTAQ